LLKTSDEENIHLLSISYGVKMQKNKNKDEQFSSAIFIFRFLFLLLSLLISFLLFPSHLLFPFFTSFYSLHRE